MPGSNDAPMPGWKARTAAPTSPTTSPHTCSRLTRVPKSATPTTKVNMGVKALSMPATEEGMRVWAVVKK